MSFADDMSKSYKSPEKSRLQQKLNTSCEILFCKTEQFCPETEQANEIRVEPDS